jgi:hypothetical protein
MKRLENFDRESLNDPVIAKIEPYMHSKEF